MLKLSSRANPRIQRELCVFSPFHRWGALRSESATYILRLPPGCVVTLTKLQNTPISLNRRTP